MFAVQSHVILAQSDGARVLSCARTRLAVAHRRSNLIRLRAPFATTAAAPSDDTEVGADAPAPGVILVFGFHPDEVAPLADLVGELAQDMEVGDPGSLAVARVAGDALGVSAEFLLDGAEMEDVDDVDSVLPPAARCVLLRGDAAKSLMPDLKLAMVEMGFEPAVFGVFVEKHAGLPLGAVASAVIKAHERYWDLGAMQVSTNDADDKQSNKNRLSTSTSWPGEESWQVSDTVCAMSVTMDSATVPDPPAFPYVDGGDVTDEVSTRKDQSAVVVLDGVVGDDLRAAMLSEITELDWLHATATAPPDSKWAKDTNDGVNSEEGEEDAMDDTTDDDDTPPNKNKKSWGLTSEALETVATAKCSETFLNRLGALYPEYRIRLMPAGSLEPEGIPGGMSGMFGNGNDGGDGGSRIATVVGNAATHDDSFMWHLDMDPGSLDPSSPFAERFGRYVNRSFARPLFVSALIYLNGPECGHKLWTPDMDAETLVLDPGTGTGVFIRPGPGRVLLMDQDALHRVSPPSRKTKIPRYSLVFKLCFYPKDFESRPTLVRQEWGGATRFGTGGGRVAGRGMVGGCEEE